MLVIQLIGGTQCFIDPVFISVTVDEGYLNKSEKSQFMVDKVHKACEAKLRAWGGVGGRTPHPKLQMS